MDKSKLEEFPKQFSENIEDANSQADVINNYQNNIGKSRDNAEKDAKALALLANELNKREETPHQYDQLVDAKDILQTQAISEDKKIDEAINRKAEKLESSIRDIFHIVTNQKNIKAISFNDEEQRLLINEEPYSYCLAQALGDARFSSGYEPGKLLADPKVVEKFIENTGILSILTYMKPSLAENKVFLHRMIKRDINALAHFPDKLKNDPEFILEVIKKNPNLMLGDLEDKISKPLYETLRRSLDIR